MGEGTYGKGREGDLLQGTLDMLILKTLARGAKHGYAIAEWICASSDDVLRVEEGALYPALHRLELRGLLEAEWGVSENNRRARFYRLTRRPKSARRGCPTLESSECSGRSGHGRGGYGMSGWNQLRLRLRALFHRRNFERDVNDEIAFHLDMRQRKLQERGMEASMTRAAAHARFGNATQTSEALRELRGWGWIEGAWQDIRLAFRQMRLHRGFAAAAILPLALAIGCIAAVFSLVDAVLFRPTGVADPGRVAAVYTFSRSQNRYLSDSYPDFRDIRALDGVVDSAAAYIATKFNNVRLTQGLESMNVDMVTGDYCRAAGVVPALGRPLVPEDDRPEAAPVALASYPLWENRFQRSPSILGSTVSIGGISFTIVGVMPKGYQGMLLDWYSDSSFWVPLKQFHGLFPADYENRRDTQMLMMLARLRPGISIERFQAALDVLAQRVADSLGKSSNPDYRFLALPASQARFWPAYRASTVRFLWLLIAVAGTALAIACFNLASLLLARAAARQQEIAARLALGAGRLRLVRQFLIENVVLAMCACALSVPVAMGLTAWYPGVQITQGFTMTVKLDADWRALGLGMAAGLITCTLAGVIPALRATRGDVTKRQRAPVRTCRISSPRLKWRAR